MVGKKIQCSQLRLQLRIEKKTRYGGDTNVYCTMHHGTKQNYSTNNFALSSKTFQGFEIQGVKTRPNLSPLYKGYKYSRRRMCVFSTTTAQERNHHRPRRSRALRRPLLPPLAFPPSCAPPPPPAFISHLLLSSPALAFSLFLSSIDATRSRAARRIRYGPPPPSLPPPFSDRRRQAASPEVSRVAFSASWLREPRRPASCNAIACWVFACFSGPDRF